VQAVSALIGHQRATLRGSEVQAILNCDHNLVARQVAAGELVRAGIGQPGARSPLLLRESLANFLLRRRIQ
jgi:hypothetical protein